MKTRDVARNNTQATYYLRFQQVIDYIYAHLDEPLDLYRLADIACMSTYHWHRVYQGMCGETLKATIIRLRLHRAAGYLAQSNKTQAQIAKASGYTSVQSFSRAFSQTYGMPPARYREQGSHTTFTGLLKAQCPEGGKFMHDIKLKHSDEIQLVGVAHQGSYMEVGQAFEQLFSWLGMKGLINQEVRSIGIFYDDPGVVAETDLRSIACASVPSLNGENIVNSELQLPENLQRLTLESGEYAVLRYKGPYAGLRSAYDWLFGHWLPNSGREAKNSPAFEEYLNHPREVGPNDLITDIYLPLKPE